MVCLAQPALEVRKTGIFGLKMRVYGMKHENLCWFSLIFVV